jgi:uncharacterized membrane protein YgcG
MSRLWRLATALLLLASAFGPAQAEERILRFVSEVAVQRNGDLIVTETIRVRAEGKEIRRGIARDFPTVYTREDGARVNVGFEVLSVVRDGALERYALERKSNGWSVRIGDPDRLLTQTPHEYVIRYRTTRQLGFFPEFDELYWNATGTGWTFPIDEAVAIINLPDAVPFGRTALYTGPQGARGRDAAIVEQRPGRIVFRTTRPLPIRNGLTVAAAWPKGVVAPPEPMQQAGWLLQDNIPLAIAFFGLVFMLGYYGLAWRLVGRDPPRGTVIPLFAPPDGMSAAAVRYVDRMSFDEKCFSVAIIDLGVKGHVKLTGEGGDMVVHSRNGGQPIPSAEQDLKSKLFASGTSLSLSQANHEPIGNAKLALSEGLSRAFLGKLFANNFAWSGAGFLATAAVLAAVAWRMNSTLAADQVPAMPLGMLLPLIPIMAGAAAVRAGVRRGDDGKVLAIAGLAVAGIAAAAGLAVMFAYARGVIEVLPAVAAYIMAPLAGLAFRWLQAPSRSGRKVMDRIEGFRQYLGVAEEDRLEFLHPPEKTPELFERFLPYAVALDVENTWAQRFAGVLAAAGVSAAAASWYAGDRDFSRDPVGFADHLGGELSDTIASSSSPPGSSSGSDSDSGGGGGGGSSGGGGGGGGGSGW